LYVFCTDDSSVKEKEYVELLPIISFKVYFVRCSFLFTLWKNYLLLQNSKQCYKKLCYL